MKSDTCNQALAAAGDTVKPEILGAFTGEIERLECREDELLGAVKAAEDGAANTQAQADQRVNDAVQNGNNALNDANQAHNLECQQLNQQLQAAKDALVPVNDLLSKIDSVNMELAQVKAERDDYKARLEQIANVAVNGAPDAQ